MHATILHVTTCCSGPGAEYQPNGAAPVSSSAVAVTKGQIRTPSGKAYDYPVPRALEASEIPGIVKAYADGARNALKAGFQGARTTRSLQVWNRAHRTAMLSFGVRGHGHKTARSQCCFGVRFGDPRPEWVLDRPVLEKLHKQTHRPLRGLYPQQGALLPGGVGLIPYTGQELLHAACGGAAAEGCCALHQRKVGCKVVSIKEPRVIGHIGAVAGPIALGSMMDTALHLNQGLCSAACSP